MTAQKKKALELIEKFGDKSIEVVQEIILYVTKGEPDWTGKTIELQELQNEIQSISRNFLFDKALLNKATIKQSEYFISVDTYDEDAPAYCFGRKVDGVFEIILAKTMRDENEFKQEVDNLAKYFNADVIS